MQRKNFEYGNRTIRSEKGAILPLIVSGCIATLMLITAFVQLSLYFGGSAEVRDGVDSGALNVAKEIPTIKVRTANSIENEFEDVADTSGEFGITNINRVWAKALLINANVQAMDDEGTGSSQARAHGDVIFEAANSISDKLRKELLNKQTRYEFFNNVAGKNDPRMLGVRAETQALPGKQWRESYVDRGMESNVTLKTEQFPGNTASALNTIKVNNRLSLPGYTAVNVRNRNFFFVPFVTGQRPHLIAGSTFDQNSKEVARWANPIANAYAAHGKTLMSGRNVHEAISFSQVYPQRTFELSIPHAFIRVKLLKNTLRFNVNGTPHPEADEEYPFTSPKPFSNTFPDGRGAGTVTASGTVGLQYVPSTLFQAIYALPANNTAVKATLLQRCKQFAPDCTEAELTACLQACPLTAGVDEYLVFPVGDDKKGPVKLMAAPARSANSSAPWIRSTAQADGTEKEFAKEIVSVVLPAPSPNTATVILAGAGTPVYLPSSITEIGTRKFKPGSGFGQCLGELSIERETRIDANGFTIPPVAP